MKLIQYAIVASLILSASLPIKAQAADPRFCDDYARATLRQIDVAEHECGNLATPDNPRWSGGYRHHYDWCRGVDREKARSESIGRLDILSACEHH